MTKQRITYNLLLFAIKAGMVASCNFAKTHLSEIPEKSPPQTARGGGHAKQRLERPTKSKQAYTKKQKIAGAEDGIYPDRQYNKAAKGIAAMDVMWRRIQAVPEHSAVAVAAKLIELPKNAELVSGDSSGTGNSQTYRIPFEYDAKSGNSRYWYLTLYSAAPSSPSEDFTFARASIWYDTLLGRKLYVETENGVRAQNLENGVEGNGGGVKKLTKPTEPGSPESEPK